MEIFKLILSLSYLLSTVHLFIIIEADEKDSVEDVSMNETAKRNAAQHIRQMEARVCSSPVPKLFVVDDIRPAMGGYYKPHCVELHRCNNDAGCCKEETMVCAPLEIETVHLYVAFLRLSAPPRILLMPFKNHTTCGCQPLTSEDYEQELQPGW